MYFSIFVLFIVDTTSILKLVFPIVYCFCIDGCFGRFVVAVIVTIVVIFTYLFIYLFIYSSTYLFIYLIIYLFIYFQIHG